eukprot:GILK01010690.1.p1 GENE.GILK01010690.1~~GILK01010690.1.p1  ORF type:complete len:349 (-),score=59.40 GILK01010690.1:117-1163(-)
MEPVTNLSGIDPARKKLLCSVCGQRCGACIQCAVTRCVVAFHPSCAKTGGLRMVTTDDKHTSRGVRLQAFCLKHSQKAHAGPPPPLAKKPKHRASTKKGSKSKSHDDKSVRPLGLGTVRTVAGPNVLCSALTDSMQAKVMRFMSLCNGSVADRFDSQVTHLLVSTNKRGLARRTMKYLFAILAGKWIVNTEWVHRSLQVGAPVDESEFEVEGDLSCLGGPRRGRTKKPNQPPLFHDILFYFYGNFGSPNPIKSDLTALVNLGGGRVIIGSEIDSNHVMLQQARRVIVICDCYVSVTSVEPLLRLHENVQALSVGWLLDCVSSYRLSEPSSSAYFLGASQVDSQLMQLQ